MNFIKYSVFICLFTVCSGFSERVGNPDDLAKIERPCPTYDLNCIRTYFHNHAHCKKAFGPVPDPIYRRQVEFNLPKINLTATAVDQRVNGLNGRIEEFYINRETDKLVIAVEFTNVTETSNNNYLKFERQAKEPVVTVGYGQLIFDALTITAVIPKLDDLQLDKSECTTYSGSATPRQFIVEPAVAESNDPQVALTLAALFANLPILVQELFLTESAYFISTYIQYNICDFGLLI